MRTLPDRFVKLLQTCQSRERNHYPPTEIYNETWMLRLLLDWVLASSPVGHPLAFLEGATWYSEFRIPSPFYPRKRSDGLGEGYTRADGVIGHVDIVPGTRSGLALRKEEGSPQFIVLEAKMFSGFSARTTNADNYHQVARTIACMAQMLAKRGLKPTDFSSLGFYVLGPAMRCENLQKSLHKDLIKQAVRNRVQNYAEKLPSEARALREWETEHFEPLLNYFLPSDTLPSGGRMRFISWEDSITTVDGDGGWSDQIKVFYQECLQFSLQKSREALALRRSASATKA